jgi:hypothetical protein
MTWPRDWRRVARAYFEHYDDGGGPGARAAHAQR